ncbi:MAG: D-alanyl-D-alanine carboxypeptidase family protein [Dehalococcoidia bacterium]
MKQTSPRRPVRLAPLLLAIAGFALAACGGDGTAAEVRVNTPTATPSPAATAAVATRTTPAPDSCAAFAQKADPYLLKVVDKQRGLPQDYRPTDLQAIDARWATPGFAAASMRADAASAIVQLLSAAEAQGVELRIRSSFRSYGEQARTFQFWIDQLGEAQARRESAPPGHSEHQLGTTADVISRSVGWELISEFGATAEGKWLAAHMADYGFALSYPPDGEAVTGYIYEPWHVRYVGKACAAEWRASGQVLVKFLEQLPAGR